MLETCASVRGAVERARQERSRGSDAARARLDDLRARRARALATEQRLGRWPASRGDRRAAHRGGVGPRPRRRAAGPAGLPDLLPCAPRPRSASSAGSRSSRSPSPGCTSGCAARSASAPPTSAACCAVRSSRRFASIVSGALAQLTPEAPARRPCPVCERIGEARRARPVEAGGGSHAPRAACALRAARLRRVSAACRRDARFRHRRVGASAGPTPPARPRGG